MALASAFVSHTWSASTAAASISLAQTHTAPLREVALPPHSRRLYVVGGTGGLLPLEARPEQSATSIGSLLIDDRSGDSTRTTSQQLEFIRSTTRLSVTELARVFSVARQTVHEWCHGAPLAPQNARRLQKLTDAVILLVESVGTLTAHDLRRPVRAGPSLLDTVRTDGNVLAVSYGLIETLAREAAQRARLAARFAGRRPLVLERSEFGSPHIQDDD
jgi:hypothetical protein